MSETPARRQSLADHVDASTNDVLSGATRRSCSTSRATAGRASAVHPGRIEGLRDILALPSTEFSDRLQRGALELGVDPPSDLAIEGWWDQARTLEEE